MAGHQQNMIEPPITDELCGCNLFGYNVIAFTPWPLSGWAAEGGGSKANSESNSTAKR